MELQENPSDEYDYTLHLSKEDLVTFHVALARAKTSACDKLNTAMWKEISKLNPKITNNILKAVGQLK